MRVRSQSGVRSEEPHHLASFTAFLTPTEASDPYTMRGLVRLSFPQYGHGAPVIGVHLSPPPGLKKQCIPHELVSASRLRLPPMHISTDHACRPSVSSSVEVKKAVNYGTSPFHAALALPRLLRRG